MIGATLKHSHAAEVRLRLALIRSINREGVKSLGRMEFIHYDDLLCRLIHLAGLPL